MSQIVDNQSGEAIPAGTLASEVELGTHDRQSTAGNAEGEARSTPALSTANSHDGEVASANPAADQTVEFRQIADTATIGLIVIDPDFSVGFVNRWIIDRSGKDCKTIIGASLEDAFAIKRRSRLWSAISTCLASQQASFLSHYLNRRLLPLSNNQNDGSRQDIAQNLTIKPLWSDAKGDWCCLIEVFDVTVEVERERKLRKQAADLARAKTDLERVTYATSHDLKAPLRAVDCLTGWIEHDVKDIVDGKTLSDIRLVRRRVRRMHDLLDDLLRYARLDQFKGDKVAVNLPELVHEVANLMLPPSGFGITVTANVDQIVTDQRSLEFVLRNIISNAVKHHDQEQGRIDVQISDGDTFLTINISDDGPGIHPMYQETIFEMFQTLRPRDSVEGTGMGLAFVRKIVRNCGGEVTVISQPPARGTTFQVRWPHNANPTKTDQPSS